MTDFDGVDSRLLNTDYYPDGADSEGMSEDECFEISPWIGEFVRTGVSVLVSTDANLWSNRNEVVSVGVHDGSNPDSAIEVWRGHVSDDDHAEPDSQVMVDRGSSPVGKKPLPREGTWDVKSEVCRLCSSSAMLYASQ